MRLRQTEAIQTARKTWKIQVPEDLDYKASQLAKEEGTNKSAIISARPWPATSRPISKSRQPPNAEKTQNRPRHPHE